MMTDDASLDDAAGLTRHIEARYHQRHRAQLPRVAEMAAKVETVHFGNEALPKGLSDLLRRMIGEMEVHMKKEELILFPAIRAGGRSEEPGGGYSPAGRCNYSSDFGCWFGAGFTMPLTSWFGIARLSSSTVQWRARWMLRETCRWLYREACQPLVPMTWPLMAPPASVHSHATMPAISSVVPNLPSGILESM